MARRSRWWRVVALTWAQLVVLVLLVALGGWLQRR
jgi:hypothetical protein